jgi:adenylate cyclase
VPRRGKAALPRENAKPGSRRLAAILAADVVGYSRLIGVDESGTLAKLASVRSSVIDPQIATHGGRVFKTTGDGLLAEFTSGVQAVQCAIAIQHAMRAQEGIELRIGLHSADVTVQPDGDLLGDGVNVAARLEGLAEPGGICISGRVREDVSGKLSLAVDDLGTPGLKNIGQPIRVFRVRVEQPERPALPLPDKPSLVVLPFQNMSGDVEQEYFADGIVEDITTALARSGWVFVIARNSAFTYKGRSVDVRQVGRELGVRYVLEGSIRRAAGRVRIAGQLIEAATGHHVWADRFDGETGDIFELQDRITESVVGAIEPKLQHAEIRRASAKPTDSLDAYDLYLQALSHFYSITRDGYDKAADLLNQVLRLDGNYSQAKALLSYVYSGRISIGWGRLDDAARALALAEEALAADRDDPNILRIVGQAIAYNGGDIGIALAAVDRAISLNPASAQVLQSAGWVHNWAGSATVAIDCFQRALRLSPLDPIMVVLIDGLGWACLQEGRNDDAHGWLQRALRERPFPSSLRGLIAVFTRLGRSDDARAAAERLLGLVPDFRISTWRFPWRDANFVREQQDAFRLAGLPE